MEALRRNQRPTRHPQLSIMAADRSLNQPDLSSSSNETTVVSPAVRKRLQRCFERGKEVIRQEKPDHDYAHTMFAECVLQDPGNLEYVEAMLENLQRKYNNNKRGARLKGFGGRGPFKKAVAAEDWPDVFQLGLDLLRTNPWDVATLRALAYACQANHHNEVELRYLKNALDVNRKDIGVNQHCAESLARMGQFDQAIACWHRIEELDKGNIEARRKISELTLAKSRGLTGLDTSSSTASGGRPTGRSTPPAPSQSSGAGRTQAHTAASAESTPDPSEAGESVAPVEALEAAVAADEGDLDRYVELAEAYTAESRFRDAFQTLKRALEASGGHNLAIREKLEDSQVRMIRAQVAIAERRAAAEATQEAADLARRFRLELNRQEMMILSARCERYPEDLSLQYELGLRLKRDENFREARRAFEAARAEPSLNALATLELGECFQQLKQYGNALKCYQAATTASEAGTPAQKLALYRTGVLATALKDLEVAREALERLVALDRGFRDALARLDKLNQIGDSV